MVISEFWVGNKCQSQQVLVQYNNIKVAFWGKENPSQVKMTGTQHES